MVWRNHDLPDREGVGAAAAAIQFLIGRSGFIRKIYYYKKGSVTFSFYYLGSGILIEQATVF